MLSQVRTKFAGEWCQWTSTSKSTVWTVSVWTPRSRQNMKITNDDHPNSIGTTPKHRWVWTCVSSNWMVATPGWLTAGTIWRGIWFIFFSGHWFAPLCAGSLGAILLMGRPCLISPPKGGGIFGKIQIHLKCWNADWKARTYRLFAYPEGLDAIAMVKPYITLTNLHRSNMIKCILRDCQWKTARACENWSTPGAPWHRNRGTESLYLGCCTLDQKLPISTVDFNKREYEMLCRTIHTYPLFTKTVIQMLLQSAIGLPWGLIITAAELHDGFVVGITRNLDKVACFLSNAFCESWSWWWISNDSNDCLFVLRLVSLFHFSLSLPRLQLLHLRIIRNLANQGMVASYMQWWKHVQTGFLTLSPCIGENRRQSQAVQDMEVIWGY